MDDYAPNSHKYREENQSKTEERRVEKVISGTAKVRKKNDMHKLADVFISEDVKNVKSYVLMDVLVPTIKKAIVDIVSDGINMIFFGGTAPRKNGSTTPRVSYRDHYNNQNNRYSRSYEQQESRFDYGDLSFPTRGDAVAVLDEMNNCISKYGFVTVADMYDIADVTHPYTSAKYGWTNLSSAEIKYSMGEYVIKLPKARPIDD